MSGHETFGPDISSLDTAIFTSDPLKFYGPIRQSKVCWEFEGICHSQVFFSEMCSATNFLIWDWARLPTQTHQP
jgi:hypothetical protein